MSSIFDDSDKLALFAAFLGLIATILGFIAALKDFKQKGEGIDVII